MDFKLNNGASIPAVGLGTGQADKGLIAQAVKAALHAGYHHIDCASQYGNQQEIGEALREVFESGLVKREDVWITSKLWCTDHDPEEVPKAAEKTLQDLQLDYLDLYLIHWPVHLKKDVKGWSLSAESFAPLNLPATWKAMEKLVETGKTRSIGISNFSAKKIETLLSTAKIPPAVNQAYSPIGSSGLSVLKDPVEEVAEKLGKTPAQVALRWGLQAGNSVLPKSTNVDRLKSNLQLFDFSIPDEDFAKFSTIPQGRVIAGEVFAVERGPYQTLQELWDE